ncbi:MAG: hemerythrin domain-containing protein [Candidatus Limnocylindrales bacterium]
MLSLAQTTHEHDEAILSHVDRIPALADMVVDGPGAEFRARFEEEYRFITAQLVPHVQAVEHALYPELEQLMACCHSMTAMRREHQELSRLVGSLGRYRSDLEAGRLGQAEQTGLRRALYRLHSILKVHLAEERLYVGLLDHNLSPEAKDGLARAMDHALAEPL